MSLALFVDTYARSKAQQRVPLVFPHGAVLDQRFILVDKASIY